MGSVLSYKIAKSTAGPTKRRPQFREAVSCNRKHAIHWRFHLDFPIPAIGLQAKESDVRRVDSVFAMDPNKTVFVERNHNVANRSHINQRLSCPKANFGFPTAGLQVVDIFRVEHAVLASGNVHQNTSRAHDGVVARLGHGAHGLAAHRMSWWSGE